MTAYTLLYLLKLITLEERNVMFIFAADLHIDMHTWNGNRGIQGDSLASLELLLSAAEQLKCPLVLGGDVFDTKLIHPAVVERVRIIRSLHKDVLIYFIQGNHDNIEPSWTTLLLDGHCINHALAAIEEDKIYGINFCLSADFPVAVAKAYPYSDAILCHQTFNCFSGVGSAISTAAVDAFPLVLAGDYHEPLIKVAHNTTIVSPGSTNRRTVAEPIPHAVLVHSAKQRMFSQIELPHRQMVVIDIDSTVEQAKEALQQQDINHARFCVADPAVSLNVSLSDESSLAIKKPILVLRGCITQDGRSFWNTSELNDSVHLLFSPTAAKPAQVADQDIVETSVVRGSTQFISEVLSTYTLPKKVKTIASDIIFGDYKLYLEQAYNKFRL